MARALLEALSSISASGFLNGDTEADVRTSLAHMILAECGRGERDERKLVAYAVSRYRQSRGAINSSLN
jgi:hypothetical protein